MKRILKEVTEYPVELIERWMRNAQPSDYPFNYMFDDKWRVMFRLSVSSKDLANAVFGSPFPSAIVVINGLAKAKEFAIDYEKDLVTRHYTRVNPKDGKEYPSVERYTIGTFLGRVMKEFTNKSPYEQIMFLGDVVRHTGDGMLGVFTRFERDPESAWRGQWVESTEEEVVKLFNQLAIKPRTYTIMQDITKYWNTWSHKYTGEGLVNSSSYYVIISQNPIDVLRMSDFENIRSCHTESHKSGYDEQYHYFYCALQEAQGHGPIAYVITEEDAEQILKDDLLQEDELFYDEERDTGIRGIEPIGRVRIRELRNIKDNFSLALPEEKVYGAEKISLILYGTIVKWLKEAQASVIPREYTEPDTVIDLNDYTIEGGSYVDSYAIDGGVNHAHETQSSSRWSVYFKRLFPQARFMGEIRKREEDDLGYEDPEGRADQPSGPQIDEDYIAQSIRRFNNNSSYISLDYSIDGGEQDYVSYDATLDLLISEDDIRSCLDLEYAVIEMLKPTDGEVREIMKKASRELSVYSFDEWGGRVSIGSDDIQFQCTLDLGDDASSWDDDGGIDDIIRRLDSIERDITSVTCDIVNTMVNQGNIVYEEVNLEYDEEQTLEHFERDDEESGLYAVEFPIMPYQLPVELLPSKIVAALKERGLELSNTISMRKYLREVLATGECNQVLKYVPRTKHMKSFNDVLERVWHSFSHRGIEKGEYPDVMRYLYCDSNKVYGIFRIKVQKEEHMPWLAAIDESFEDFQGLFVKTLYNYMMNRLYEDIKAGEIISGS